MNCPYCHAEIDDSARKCRHCGEWVREPPRPPPKKARRLHAAEPAPAPAPPVTVVTVRSADSSFAIVTLVFYFIIPPLAPLLNLIGLLTGPRRGCFLSMFLLFIVAPVVIVFGVMGLTIPELRAEIVRLFHELTQSIGK